MCIFDTIFAFKWYVYYLWFGVFYYFFIACTFFYIWYFYYFAQNITPNSFLNYTFFLTKRKDKNVYIFKNWS